MDEVTLTFFKGEDKKIRFKLRKPSTWVDAVDGEYSVPDMSLWSIYFVARKKDTSNDAIIERAIDGIEGTHNADPNLNAQYAYILLDSDETDLFSPNSKGDPFRYSFKRMDDGSETILVYGDLQVLVATAR